MARIQPNSRLRYAVVLTDLSFEFWDFIVYPEVPERPDDLFHEVTGFDRIDKLAFQFYQDVRFYWVIAVANGMEILPTDLNRGDILRIPSPRFVLEELIKQRVF